MELILEDADIITMAPEPRSPAADSMLIRDGYIAAVGSAAQIRALAARNAAVVHLDGATVIPGLIDAHCHVSDVGYLAAAADCSQPAAPDIPAIVARLRDQAGRTPDGSWVTGAGYVEYKLREDRHPTRADLDAAVPDRPAVLYHTSLHACVLNSVALREAGLADGQPDPPGGAFGRDGQGRLDGVVFEGPMFALFERNLHHDLGELGPDQRARVVRTAGERLAALGVTAVCEADLRRDSFTAFAEADAAGALHQRIYGLVVHDEVDWLLAAGLRGRRSDRLAAEAVKIWADGGMSSRTAAISGQYPVPPYGSGILYFDRPELTELVRGFDAQGFQVCIHAQGDRAIETVLDAYAAVLPAAPDPAGSPGVERNPRRHRIEHGGALYPELLGRAAELNILVATQPGFFSTLGRRVRGRVSRHPRPAVRDRVLAAGRPDRGRVLRRPGDQPGPAARPARRGAAPHRRRAGPRPGGGAHRGRRAGPVHPPGRLRHAPGDRDRVAGGGPPGRFRGPGRQPADHRPGADHRPQRAGHRAGRRPGPPGRRDHPRLSRSGAIVKS